VSLRASHRSQWVSSYAAVASQMAVEYCGSTHGQSTSSHFMQSFRSAQLHGAQAWWLIVAGYTPLHMASGYMHTGPMAALLEAGADPLIKDKQGEQQGKAGVALRVCLLSVCCSSTCRPAVLEA